MYRQRKRIVVMAECRVGDIGLTHLETVIKVACGNVEKNKMMT